MFQETGKFYSKRSKLYEEGLELLLVQWDKSREVERNEVYRDLSVERKLELLSYVAVKKFEQEQYVLFEQEELEGYIGEFLGIERRESQGVLRAIASVHGLLIERSYKVWSFSHLTFQEYLVAKWLMENQQWQGLIDDIGNQKFHQVFLLLASILSASDSEFFFKLIQNYLNKLVRNNKRIQGFLTWAKNKADSIKDNRYKKSAIRAFYVYFAQINLSCIQELLHPEKKNLAYTIDSNFRRDVAISYKEYTKDGQFLFSFSNDIAIDVAFSLLFDDDIALPFAIKQMQSIFELELAPQFKLELQFLIHLLPNKINDWNQKEWKNWLNKMRHSMINNCDIGQEIKFTNSQKKILNKYYNGNFLLVNCLYASSYSLEISQQIENALLLPIAEIEKRKRKSIE